MDKRFTVRGYHVTPRSNADSIHRLGFKPSTNPYDWLGEGIYFFQDGPNFAYHWGTSDRRAGRHDDLALFAADIELHGFIDLLDFAWGQFLREASATLEESADPEYLKAKEKQKEYEFGVDQRQGHWLDQYVIQAAASGMKEKGIEVMGVRSAFWEGAPLYEKSHIMDRQHIQIAVRNVAAIKDYWEEVLED